MTQLSFATQCLDHLGIVAGICHRIDLIETIDTFIRSNAASSLRGRSRNSDDTQCAWLCGASVVFDAGVFF